jgi:hypothetical protein
LKGSCGNLGARQMAATYGELEITDFPLTDPVSWLRRLDQEFELIREILNAERHETAD